VREQVTLLPQAVGLVAGGLLRFALNRLGIAAWLRFLVSGQSNRGKMKRLAEYRRAWRQYRGRLEQHRQAAIDREFPRHVPQQGG